MTKMKGRRKKFTILNQLYRRFTNRRRGYTPRKIDLKKVTDPFYYIESLGVKSFPLFNGISRIYSLPQALNLRLRGKAFLLDQYSFSNPQSLIALASTLSKDNIAICTYSSDSEYIYDFPFRKKSSLTTIHYDQPKQQITERLLPGVYFTREHRWGYTLEYSDNIHLYERDVNEGLDDSMYDVRESAIYIPFDAIETPILQAYVPVRLGTTVNLSSNKIIKTSDVFDMGVPLDLRSDECYWMGINIDCNIEHKSSKDYSEPVYQAKDFLEVEYIAEIARQYFVTQQTTPTYWLIYRSILDPIITTRTFNSYKMQGFTNLNIGSGMQNQGSNVRSKYMSSLTNNAYLCSVRQYVSYGTPKLDGIILGEYSKRNVTTASYKYFNKEAREALERLAIPVGEQFPISNF